MCLFFPPPRGERGPMCGCGGERCDLSIVCCMCIKWTVAFSKSQKLHVTTKSIYKFSLPPGLYVETCTSFYVLPGPRWLTSWVGNWTPHPIAPSFDCFLSMNAPVPAPLVSTHHQQQANFSVWRNSPSVASTSTIFERAKIVTFQKSTLRHDVRWCCSIKMRWNDGK